MGYKINAPRSHVRLTPRTVEGMCIGYPPPYDFDMAREELTIDELRRLRDVMEREPQSFDNRALVMKLQRMAVQP